MEAKTLNEIHKQGIDALVKVLGPVDAVRFLQIYDQGSGDYTKERKQWLEKDPDKYLAAVIAHGKKKTGGKFFLSFKNGCMGFPEPLSLKQNRSYSPPHPSRTDPHNRRTCSSGTKAVGIELLRTDRRDDLLGSLFKRRDGLFGRDNNRSSCYP